MARTKFYLDLRGKASDGKGSLLIMLYNNKTRTSISTGIRLLKKQWKDDRVVNHPDADSLNVSLNNKKNELDKRLTLFALNNDISLFTAIELKTFLYKKQQPKSIYHPIKKLFKEYTSSKMLNSKTISLYDLTLKKVLAFSGDINIENMDMRWYSKFDKYLASSQKTNGKAVYERCLRAVFNYARDTGIACPYPFKKVKIKHEETAKRSVSLEKLAEFYKCEVNQLQAKARDYFFLIFYLIGINTKDLLLAKKSQVKSGRLEYNRFKTGKKYSIKIEPEAEELIKKYSGSGEFLLEAMDHNKHYTSFSRWINETLSSIIYEGEQVIPGITTYMARHTWATLAYELDIPAETISQALGHTYINRTTSIYIKPNQSKVDKANRKVLDCFKQSL